MSNPWAARWKTFADPLDREDTALHKMEADDAESRPVLTCPKGHKAYYRPGVGAYKCPTCGLLRVTRWNGKHGDDCDFDERWV